MKKTPKTNIHIGISAYLMAINQHRAKAFTKKEQREICDTLWNALNMLQSLNEPVDPMILDNALANLLAYIVSNGKNNITEKFNHLGSIVLKTRLTLELAEQTPLAEVLDYIHNKKKHPLTGILK